ncbi:MAG: GDYXXLXY domain-containing protein, partial [Chromatiaceae bacterium]
MPEGVVRLSERTRLFVLVAMTVAILVFVNLQIMQKEDIIENGETLLLRLAPQDPRSLLQGDYMALRYAMTRDIALAARETNATD